MVRAYIVRLSDARVLDVSGRLIDQPGSLHILREMQDELTYEPVVSSANFSVSDLDSSVAEFLNLPNLSSPTRRPIPAIAHVFDKRGDIIFTGDIDTDGAVHSIFNAENPDDSRRLNLTSYDKLKALSLQWKNTDAYTPSNLLRLVGRDYRTNAIHILLREQFRADVKSAVHYHTPVTMQDLLNVWMRDSSDKITVAGNNDGDQVFIAENMNCTVGQTSTVALSQLETNEGGNWKYTPIMAWTFPSIYEALQLISNVSLATIVAMPTGEIYYVERFANPKDIVPPIRIAKYTSSQLLGGTKKSYLSHFGLQIDGNDFDTYSPTELYYWLSDDEKTLKVDRASHVKKVKDEYSVISTEGALMSALPYTYANARQVKLANGSIVPEFSMVNNFQDSDKGVYASRIITRVVREALLSSRSFEIVTQADKFFATQRVIVENNYHRILSADIDPFADTATLKIYPTGDSA